MAKTLRLVSLAALLTTGAAMAMAAPGGGGAGSESVTGAMTGSQQTGTPTTGATVNTQNGQYHEHAVQFADLYQDSLIRTCEPNRAVR
jgi:hypothetical protein